MGKYLRERESESESLETGKALCLGFLSESSILVAVHTHKQNFLSGGRGRKKWDHSMADLKKKNKSEI